MIAEADEITVVFNDDSEYPAKLIGRDTKTDLALLKIERPEPFPHVEWADSDAIRVGDWMFAIGNPFGLGSSVTAGIVSARGRDIRAGPYDDFIQVDAAINRGNSGGPSFTLDGQVFGVNTAIFSPSGGNVGIGFAIPANLARPVIDSLMRTGRVARGWLGVRIQTVTERDRRKPGPARGPRCAGRQHHARRAGRRGRHPGRRCHPRVRRQGGRPHALPAAAGRRDAASARRSRSSCGARAREKTLKVVLGELPEDEQLAELGQPQPTRAGTASPHRAPGDDRQRRLPELRTQFSSAMTPRAW